MSGGALGKHGAYLLFLLALVSAAFALWFTAARIPLDDMHLTRPQPAAFSSGWSAVTDGQALPLDEVSRPAAGRVGQPLLLANTLPQPLAGQLCLAFQTKNETVRVWVGEELVYIYGERPQLIFGHGVGAMWNLAQLPEDAGGQPLLVELVPVDNRTGLSPYVFLLGDRSEIFSQLLLDRLPLLAVCLLLALIGFASLVVAAVASRRGGQGVAALYFAIFVLLATVWTLADSGLLQFVLHNKGVSYLLFGCSFYLMGTPLMLYMAAMLPEHQRLFRALAAVNALYSLTRILLYVSGVLDFEKGLWLLHAMMGVLLLISNLILWLPMLRTRRLSQPYMCLAFTSFALVEAASLISFYYNDKLDMLRSGYSSGFYTGILLFVVITAIGAARKTQQLRQQAFKAEFFERRAYLDDLTGLLNIKGFDDKCDALLREGAAKENGWVLVDFDVNFFSQFNANNGVDAGDELLRRIAAVIQDNCRPDELCARQEADHFVCLLRGDLETILERIRSAERSVRERLSERLLLLSYGVVLVTDRGLSPAALRNQAVVAKRQVKGNYEQNIAVYDRQLHELQLQEVALLSGFATALEHDEYVIFLQPKVDAATEQVCGAEALVRRLSPDGSLMSAGPIIEVLERKGFVAKLDYYILEQVCRLLRRCLDEGRQILPVSSNFSRVHLYDPDFPQRVAEITDKYRLPHELVEIELTESVFLAGKEMLQTMVRRLHEQGFQVSIDDFGSGYSSLNVLKDVEVDIIKLDREFLADFASERRAGTIIEHTLRLAQQLGITTVAEGIETRQQLEFLRRVGCDLVQGYYYSPPLPEDEFLAQYAPVISPCDGSGGGG